MPDDVTVAATEQIDTRFELLERVGSGAFGEVWRAMDHQVDAVVAVKRLHAHLTDAAAIARFFREASMLARVHSAHVVRYVAHGRDANQRPWIATEWLVGEDMFKWRTRPGITLGDALAVVRDAARGAAALHAAGIVHRDLKPNNILVATHSDGTRYGKIVDLGIAHGMDVTVLTQTGTILGSPSYMAPEQVRGEDIDGRVDLWALGVLLFELLTGEPPFGTNNAIAVLGKVLLEPVPPVRMIRPDAPDDLEQLIGRLLEKQRERRLSSAREVAEQIDAVLARHHTSPILLSPPASVGSQQDLPTTQHTRATHGERRLVALVFARPGADTQVAPVRDAFERFGGRAEPLRGTWLGGFGLSRARGDELVAAARAAREVQKTGAAVALVTGWAEVRAGAVVAGQLIDRGATLVDRTATGELRVLQDAATRLDANFHFEHIEGAEYRFVRERGAGSLRPPGAPPLLLGRAVPALGREKEIRLLEGVFLECVDDHASRLALLIGEAGLGKSRLRYELCARLAASAAPPQVVSFIAEPMLAEVPHGLFSKGLREAAGVEEGEGADASRARLENLAGRAVDRDASVLDFLGELMRLPGSADPRPLLRAARSDPALMQQRVREALAAFFRGLTRAGPLLFAIDDLHWTDSASVDLLAWLFEELRGEPVTFVAFARPELFDRHPLIWQGVARTELRLAPLSQRVSDQIVATVLDLDDTGRRAIVERAGGNPLFLEALIRAKAEGVQDLPVAVHAALQVRLDALGDEARRLAQTASVFGLSFWAEGLTALRSNAPVAPALGELLRAEIAVERHVSRFAGATEYGFAHALVRDAAYAMLVDDEARDLHARAGQWLEKVGESDPATIGRHFEIGRRTLDAARHYARAATTALGESAYDGAERYATRSLSCEPPPTLAVQMLLLRAEARRALGRTAEMLDDACAAEKLSTEDPALEIEARSCVAKALRLRGSLEEAEKILRAVLEESHAAFLGARVQALLELAMVDLAAGRGPEALALIDETLSWLDQAGSVGEYARLQALRARVPALSIAGDYGRALEAAVVALEACHATGHRARAAEALTTLGQMLSRVGAYEEAREKLETAIAEARVLRLPSVEGQAQFALGDVLAALGDSTAAIAAEARAVEVGKAIGNARLCLRAVAHSCVQRLDRGRSEDLGDVERDARDGALAAAAFAPLRCVYDAILARCATAAGRANAALELAERADQALRALGSLEDLEEWVRVAHVMALQAAGRDDDAGAALYSARDRLMRKAAKIRDLARRRTYLENVPQNRALQQLARESSTGRS